MNLLKKHGADIVENGTPRTLHYNHFAMCEILRTFINNQNMNNANEIYHGIKLQIENNWEEFLIQ